MIESTLNGKSSLDLFDDEDFLTSTFFGFVQYFSPTELWNEIFKHSLNIYSESIKDKLLKQGLKSIKNYKVKLHFWKKFDEYGEPDIILELHSNTEKKKFFIVIEVKLWSYKSNNNGEDQLIKYTNLIKDNIFKQEMFSSLVENNIIGIIYLTPRNSMREIKVSLDSSKNKNEDNNSLYGLRWQKIYDTLINIETDIDIYEKLAMFIEKIGLTPFYGFNSEFNIDNKIYSNYKAYSGGISFSGFKKNSFVSFDDIIEFYK